MEINVLQVIFQIINFGVVFAALTYFLTGPILKMIDERRLKTQEAAKAAEETLREREQLEAMKKKAKIQAEKDANTIIEEAKNEAKTLKVKLSKDAKDEVTAMKAKEMAKAESEMQARRADQEKQIGKLAVAIASKVIGADVDEKTHKTLIAQSLKDLAKAV